MGNYKKKFAEVRRNIECYSAEDVSDFLAEAEQEIEALYRYIGHNECTTKDIPEEPATGKAQTEPTEAMIEAGKSQLYQYFANNNSHEEQVTRIYKAMQAAAPGSQWVSVEDSRKPEEYFERVLIGRSGPIAAVMEGFWAHGKFMVGVCMDDAEEFKDPTHWMPLPSPPEVDSDDV